MKNLILIATLILGSNMAVASSKLKCPAGSKRALTCVAAPDSFIHSLIICEDTDANFAMNLLTEDRETSGFIKMNQTIRTGATTYKGHDLILVKRSRPAKFNATLTADFGPVVQLSCK